LSTQETLYWVHKRHYIEYTRDIILSTQETLHWVHKRHYIEYTRDITLSTQETLRRQKPKNKAKNTTTQKTKKVRNTDPTKHQVCTQDCSGYDTHQTPGVYSGLLWLWYPPNTRCVLRIAQSVGSSQRLLNVYVLLLRYLHTIKKSEQRLIHLIHHASSVREMQIFLISLKSCSLIKKLKTIGGFLQASSLTWYRILTNQKPWSYFINELSEVKAYGIN
jgi:hypothetical protein